MKVRIHDGMWEVELDKGFITAEQLGATYGWYLAGDNNQTSAEAIESELPYSNVLAINTIEVRPEHRRRGLGSKLLQTILKKAKSYGLDAVILNASPMGAGLDYRSLVNFYSKYGFKTYKAFHEYGNQTMILDLRGNK